MAAAVNKASGECGRGLVWQGVGNGYAGAGCSSYDIVYVLAPRASDNTYNLIPDAFNVLLPEPGADLLLLHPDGSEEALFSANGKGAVMDPNVAYDGRSVIFAFFPDVTNSNPQRGLNRQHALARDGADIYKIEI